MDIFTWSIPFVVEKISDIFCNILKPGLHDNDDSDEEGDAKVIKEKVKKVYAPMKLSEKGNKLRNKIKFVAKMAIMQKNLRFLFKSFTFLGFFYRNLEKIMRRS